MKTTQDQRQRNGSRYLLDEIKNDITRETPASFEPTIDYVVTKIPRFASKFPQAHEPARGYVRSTSRRCWRTATSTRRPR